MVTDQQSDTAALPQPRVDGRYLVVASGTVLPPCCVKTNQPIAESDIKWKEFHWCSPWVGLGIVISGLVLILLYFILRKKCDLAYGLHPNARKKYRKRILIKWIAIIVLFFTMPLWACIDSSLVVLCASVLFLLAVISLFFGNSPLHVHTYQDGLFWIGGFSQEYLDRLEHDDIVWAQEVICSK